MGTIVYSTSTEHAAAQRAEQARRRQHAEICNRMLNARDDAVYREMLGTRVGLCTACGSVEVALDSVSGYRDLSHLGESATYPTGYGCEVCS